MVLLLNKRISLSLSLPHCYQSINLAVALFCKSQIEIFYESFILLRERQSDRHTHFQLLTLKLQNNFFFAFVYFLLGYMMLRVYVSSLYFITK